MANLPVLTSLPGEAVDVVFDGEVNGKKWFVVHIEPTGAVNIWKVSDDVTRYQRMSYSELELVYGILGGAVRAFVDDIIASVNIEGLYRATAAGPVGGVESLSEIKYKIVQVSE